MKVNPKWFNSTFYLGCPVIIVMNFSVRFSVKNILNVKQEYIEKPLILSLDPKTDFPAVPKIDTKFLSSSFAKSFSYMTRKLTPCFNFQLKTYQLQRRFGMKNLVIWFQAQNIGSPENPKLI